MTLDNQIIFEIAMGIGSDLDIIKMLRNSLSISLRRLNCTSGVVLERQSSAFGVRLDPVFSIPRNAHGRIVSDQELRWLTAEMDSVELTKRLVHFPLALRSESGRCLYLFQLEEFGILILEKADGELSEKLIRSLMPLNGKLARACILCRQTDIIQQKNAELKKEIHQRIEAEEARKTIEHQLIQTQKLESLGVLAGGIAHDFNNLLMGILCNADIALMEVDSGSEASGCITTIKKISKQAAGLCDQILLYSGKASFKKAPVKLCELIFDMEDLIRTSLSGKTSIKYDFPEGLPEILGDSDQLRQVVLNLLINATEAIGSDAGKIEVILTDLTLEDKNDERFYFNNDFFAGRYLRLAVKDNGCGMERSVCERVFEPFFTTKFSGRGLGLASVLGVVRSHKGIIDVDTHPGEGTTFMIYFPVEIQSAVTDGGEERVTPPDEISRVRIMVVDDEFIIATLVARMLRRMGFEVDLFTEPAAAYAAFESDPDKYGLVITDMRMPEMDGAELFEKIRTINPGVRGILSSGYYESDLDDSIKEEGFDAFLHKPYEREILEQAIIRVLS